MGKAGAHISEADRKRILDMFDSGITRQDIQIQTGISQPTIRKVLSEAGHPPREINTPHRLTEAQKQQIVDLHNSGIGYTAIARNMSVSTRTVLNVIKERVDGIVSKTQSPITPYQFIKAWQESRTADEVAIQLGMTVQQVLQRAYNYRAKGVTLKSHTVGGKRYDWSELAEFAALFEDSIGHDDPSEH